MRSVITAIGFSACLMLLACNASKNENAVLRFNLQEGKTYAYSMEVDMENEIGDQKTNSEMEFKYDLQVTGRKDSLTTLKALYKRVMMKMVLPNRPAMEIDTDEPAKDTAVDFQTNPMGMVDNMFRAMVGKTFTMKVNNRGEVVEVSGLDKLFDEVVTSMKVSPDLRPAIQGMFRQQFNEENLKQSFGQAFNIYPNQAIKEGDSWVRDVNLGTPMMAATTKTTYTVKDIDANKVVLNADADLNFGKVTGKQTGTLTLDRNTGLVMEGDLVQKMGDSVNKGSTKIKFKGKEL